MSMHKGMLGRDKDGPGSADLTLADYIHRKVRQDAFDQVALEKKIECCGNPLRGCMDCPPPKKLTFEEWWNSIGIHGYGKLFEKPQCEGIWNAAQENK